MKKTITFAILFGAVSIASANSSTSPHLSSSIDGVSESGIELATTDNPGLGSVLQDQPLTMVSKADDADRFVTTNGSRFSNSRRNGISKSEQRRFLKRHGKRSSRHGNRVYLKPKVYAYPRNYGHGYLQYKNGGVVIRGILGNAVKRKSGYRSGHRSFGHSKRGIIGSRRH